MELSMEFWLQITVYAVSLGSFAGIILTRLKYIEEKQNKHNNLIERMILVEQTAQNAHYRIDQLERTQKEHEEADNERRKRLEDFK